VHTPNKLVSSNYFHTLWHYCCDAQYEALTMYKLGFILQFHKTTQPWFHTTSQDGSNNLHFLWPRRHTHTFKWGVIVLAFNLLTPNVNYSGRTAPLTSKVAFYIFIQQIYVLSILNMVYTLHFFSSKCSLFHNSNVFGSCIIHILYTGVLKLKKLFRCQKVNKWAARCQKNCL